MDKEAQEKFQQGMVETFKKWNARGTPYIAIMHKLFVKMEIYFKELGYRKLPKDKPPIVITPFYRDKGDPEKFILKAKQAQWDIWDKAIYGGER